MIDESFTSDQSLAELRLLHLADSALPIGALAHSFGLESLVSANLLGAAELSGFLQGQIEESGLLEAVFCRAASHLAKAQQSRIEIPRWLEINDYRALENPLEKAGPAADLLGAIFSRRFVPSVTYRFSSRLCKLRGNRRGSSITA